MRAVVTGGAGFIGSNLVDALVARGNEVAVVDNFSTGRRENLASAIAAGAAVHEQDIRDLPRLRSVVAKHRADVIFHLAAQIDVRHSVADPAFDADINVCGMINVLEAARLERVRRVVYSSSGGAIYGEADVYPTPEDSPLRPLAPYGQSKCAAEGYCGLYERVHGVSPIILRYANVYGPRQDPLGEGGVIAIFSGRIRGGARPTVFGDGKQTRDYTYVGDIVAANLLSVERQTTGCYNIGTGVETSVLELVEAMRLLAPDGRFAPEFAPARPGEVLRSVLDPTRAKESLGWQPRVGLQSGIGRTLESL